MLSWQVATRRIGMTSCKCGKSYEKHLTIYYNIQKYANEYRYKNKK